MSKASNGSKPQKTPEEVATELRASLERQLGSERAEAIWKDPTNVQQVVEGEEEAAAVADTLMTALQDLPAEEVPAKRRGSGFRRGLRIALIAAISVWAFSIVQKARRSEEP